MNYFTIVCERERALLILVCMSIGIFLCYIIYHHVYVNLIILIGTLNSVITHLYVNVREYIKISDNFRKYQFSYIYKTNYYLYQYTE